MEDVGMSFLTKRVITLFLTIVTFLPCVLFAADSINIPVLCYHNLSPTTVGSMNMTPQKFESEIKWLKDNGFNIIPLKEVVAYLEGQRPSLPSKPVVVSADDGWKSVYTYMLPIIKKYNIPVTLFIYPQTISAGKNALTWEQLSELKQTGLFDIQSHTYSHPNFKQMKRRLSPVAYEKFVHNELVNSKKILEDKLGSPITFLAWPFGIYNDYLEQAATNAGYAMAFSIDDHTANKSYKPMAQPRFMILEGLQMKTFIAKVNGATR